jgi:hypothetical protein
MPRQLLHCFALGDSDRLRGQSNDPPDLSLAQAVWMLVNDVERAALSREPVAGAPLSVQGVAAARVRARPWDLGAVGARARLLRVVLGVGDWLWHFLFGERSRRLFARLVCLDDARPNWIRLLERALGDHLLIELRPDVAVTRLQRRAACCNLLVECGALLALRPSERRQLRGALSLQVDGVARGLRRCVQLGLRDFAAHRSLTAARAGASAETRAAITEGRGAAKAHPGERGAHESLLRQPVGQLARVALGACAGRGRERLGLRDITRQPRAEARAGAERPAGAATAQERRAAVASRRRNFARK